VTSKEAIVMPTPNIPLGPSLTAEQAERIYKQGREAVVFALLQLAQMLAKQSAMVSANDSPTTPSGMKPPYEKPVVKSRRKRPGRKDGHPGSRRPPPEQIDRQEEHRLKCCPDCGGPVKQCHRTRTRYVEDIPADIQPVITEHTIHRDWCPHCKKSVEPVVPDALPGSTLGNRVLVLSAWLHYALGNTLSQIVEVFNYHLQMKLTSGALVQQWQRLQAILEPWYEEIRGQALHSAVLHADETSWRVSGKTHWLWCFATDELTYFMIDRCRGSPALLKFFNEEFRGTLVTDFWGAYNKVVCARRQMCLVHLLRDFLTVEKYKSPGPQWPAFAKLMRRLIHDGMRLSKREDLSADEYASRRSRMDERLQAMIDTPWEDSQARRLIKRLRRHQRHLFTFLDQPDVPFDNNHGERSIRPAVIIRKNSYCNRSSNGARTQAVLMSIYRTLKQRGHDPITTVVKALSEYLTTGKLSPLPSKTTANG
jgi:transposase